jgi:hypothetical protein
MKTKLEKYRKKHCCGTVMIYCGSGSYSGKVLVLVLVLVLVPVPVLPFQF